jgi:hypothetical protein
MLIKTASLGHGLAKQGETITYGARPRDVGYVVGSFRIGEGGYGGPRHVHGQDSERHRFKEQSTNTFKFPDAAMSQIFLVTTAEIQAKRSVNILKD